MRDKGQGEQYDPMIMKWCCTPRSSNSSEASGSAPQASMDDSDAANPITAVKSEADWSATKETVAQEKASSVKENAEKIVDTEEDSVKQKHADDIRAIGFAMIHSAAMLPEFAIPNNAKECIQWASINTLAGTCNAEDVKALEDVTHRFFARRPVLVRTPPKADSKVAIQFKRQ